MIRILAVLAAFVLATPAFSQALPAGLDKANAIVIDTTKVDITRCLKEQGRVHRKYSLMPVILLEHKPMVPEKDQATRS